MPFLPPNQQRQSTEGMFCVHNITNKNVTLAKAKPSSIQAMHKCFINNNNNDRLTAFDPGQPG